jgi:glycosyltransferase involved in cell wall biosynthesis
MPTYNRQEFIPRAISGFFAQEIPTDWTVELIVLDDGDSIKDLLPEDPRIKYFHNPNHKYNHGTKINICCEQATGEYLIVWDDDDVYAKDRIVRQIQPMIDRPEILITGSSTLFYYRLDTRQAYQYTSPPTVGWLASIAWRKATWENMKFDHIAAGADFSFLKRIPQEARLDLNDPNLIIASIHSTNASKKSLGKEYKPVPWETVQGFLEKSTTQTTLM